ncbi:MAG: HEAT repeat domain-containing protein [Pseudomonadota bacterium]
MRTFGTGIRTLLVFFLVLGTAHASSDATKRAVAILAANFDQGSPEIQKKLLREIGLLRADESIPFLASVALSESLENEIRRDALKSMLAVDGSKYRPVLDALKSTEIQTPAVVSALFDIGDPRFAELFVRRALTPDLPERDLRSAIVNALDFWDGQGKNHPPFELWRKTKASEQLIAVEEESVGTRRLRAVQAMGWVRGDGATNALIRLLDFSDPQIVAAAIEGLGHRGKDASPALGRFLMKTQSAELRRLAVESLSKIGTQASKRALKAYRSKRTAP